MTIGIDASRANKIKRTGTEWYSLNLINGLAALDNKNEYKLYTLEPPAPEFSALPANFQYRVLDWPPKRLWTQARLSAEMAIRPPDVLFVPAHTIPVIHPRTVTTCHDLGFERRPDLYPTSERAYQQMALKFALKTADKIIAVSNFTKKELINLHRVSDSKITVIHHGVDRGIFYPRDQAASRDTAVKYGLRPGQFLLYVGRLETKKNTLGLLKAFETLKGLGGHADLQLALVGSPGNGWEEIEKYSRRDSLLGHVKILNWVPQDDLPRLLSSASAFVFPSLYEGFGLPILEATACDTLTFASDIEPLREIGGQGLIYFDPLEPRQMAAAMDEGLKNAPSLKNRLKPLWQENLKRFSWEKCAAETLSQLA